MLGKHLPNVNFRFLPTKLFVLSFASLFLLLQANGQNSTDTSLHALSPELVKKRPHTKWWGEHYRKEWGTPVLFKKVMLDTLEGGLRPYAKGGGRQTKSLRLHDKNNREFVLRSLNKTFTKALPENLHGTFIETIMNDQASISHPFAPLMVPLLAEAAGILHTNPRIFYVPKQQALDSFANEFGNDYYLFEQRPDENWQTAPNFGNSKNIIGTDKLRERLMEDADNQIDQQLYARSRLFDMFIGDWSRHDDQWRWAEYKQPGKRFYKPIPRDRDMAFSKFDGKALKFAIPIAGVKHLQSFGADIENFRYYNFTARNLDLHFTNALQEEDWMNIATDLQLRLTDSVIHKAVMQLPPEVYPVSGETIEKNLKSRRNHLPEYAAKYYQQLAAYPSIAGSEKDELFKIEYLNDSATRVSMYRIRKGFTDTNVLYRRTFDAGSREIRIYGIAGEDRYEIVGKVKKGIKVRLIGGDGKDKYLDNSSVKKWGRQVKIYDDKNNTFISGKETGLHLSSYPSMHKFDWDETRYNKRGIYPVVFYNNADRIFAGITISRTQFQWRKEPFGNKQNIDLRYSISQKAPSITYEATFTDLVGNFDLDIIANYDWMRWTNYFGEGNATPLETSDRDFYRLRSKEAFLSAGLSYRTRNRHRFSAMPWFQTIKFTQDEERFVSQKHFDDSYNFYDMRKYAGIELEYVYQKIDDSILPQKGIAWQTSVNAFSKTDKNLTSAIYSSQLQLLIPVYRSLGLNFRLGGATLSGKPDFFRINSIGGGQTLRGFQRDRFYGNSTLFVQNELRWIKNIRSYLYSGKIGLFAFLDAGRVWANKNASEKIHIGYGPGLIISPFDKISISLAYGISDEDSNLHFRIIRPF